jgi:hypothetical protein
MTAGTIALAILLVTALVAVLALHVYWAVGGVWPGEDPSSLSHIVVGIDGELTMPPPRLILAVAGALGLATLTAVLLPFPTGGWLEACVNTAGLGFAAVFFLRGIAGYLPMWRRAHPLEPFARLDRIVYSPGCILIGEAFFTLVAPRVGLS